MAGKSRSMRSRAPVSMKSETTQYSNGSVASGVRRSLLRSRMDMGFSILDFRFEAISDQRSGVRKAVASCRSTINHKRSTHFGFRDSDFGFSRQGRQADFLADDVADMGGVVG